MPNFAFWWNVDFAKVEEGPVLISTEFWQYSVWDGQFEGVIFHK